MATTHRFLDEVNYAEGGEWFDDYGRRICKWSWNADAKELSVQCGLNGRRKDLSQFDENSMSDEHLRERLPSLAIEIAEDIRGVTYER
jgi:hypothetical protein